MSTQLECCPSRRQWWVTTCRLAFLAALAVLVVGSLTPSEHLAGVSSSDKVLHFGAYALVTALAMLSVRTPRNQIICLLLLIAMGVGLEIAQILVPGRSFDVGDMVANGGGVLVASQANRLLLS